MGSDNGRTFIGHLSLSMLLPGIRFAYGLILAAALSKYLSVEQYGNWSLFISMIGLVLTFSSLNLMYSSQVLLAGKDHKDQMKDIFSVSVTRVVSALFIFSIFSIYFVYKGLFDIRLLSLMLAALIFRTLNDLVFGFLRALLIIRKQVIFLLIESVLILLFVLINYAIFDGGLYGMIYAFITAEFISAAVGRFMLKEYLRFSNYDFGSVKKYLAIGIPLIPFAFSDLIINSLVPLVIKLYDSFEAVAFYSIAQKVAMVSTIPAAIVNNIYVQYLKREKDNSGRSGISRVFFTFLSIYLGMVIPVFAVLLYFGRDIIILLSMEQYAVSYDLMILLAAVNVIIMINSMLSSVFAVYNKTRIIGLIWIGVLLSYLAINRIMVPEYKLYGVAYSLLISFSAGLVCVIIALFRMIKTIDEFKPVNPGIAPETGPLACEKSPKKEAISG